MTRVESPPTIFEVHFKPRAEVHGGRGGRHTDIPQITGGITRGNMQGAAQSDREMLKIPANSKTLRINIQCSFRGTRVLIPEANFCVHPIADGLHPSPSRTNAAEQLRCNHGESVDLAIAAVQQITQDVVWQFLDRKFPRIIIHLVGETWILQQGRVAQANCALRCNEPGAAISEAVHETLY